MEQIQVDLPQNLENMTLPAPEMVNFWRLSENRIFYIDFEIDEAVMEIEKAIIAINIADKGISAEERNPIKIFINTPGGLLAETFSLCSTIMLSKTKVITVNVGEAYSAGCLILLAGHERYTFPYGKAMIHTGSGGIQGTYEQTEQAQKIYKKQIDEMGAYILERSQMDDKVYKRNKAKEWYLDAEEQIKYGIVSEIVTDLDTIL
jgi:ATP-dependent Clp protease protease subunit